MSKSTYPTPKKPLVLVGFRGKKKVRKIFERALFSEEDSRIKIVGIKAHAHRGDQSRRDPNYARRPFSVEFIVGEKLEDPYMAFHMEPRDDAMRWVVTEISPCCHNMLGEFHRGVTPVRKRPKRDYKRNECKKCVKHSGASIFSESWKKVFNEYFNLAAVDNHVWLEDVILPKFDETIDDPFEAHLAAVHVGQTMTALLNEFYREYVKDRAGFIAAFSDPVSRTSNPPAPQGNVAFVAGQNGLTLDPNSNGYIFRKNDE